jgi:hypothetical protein
MRIRRSRLAGDPDPTAPGPVTITRPKQFDRPQRSIKDRALYSGEAERKRRAWAGAPSFRQLVIAEGRVELFDQTYGEGLLRGKSCELQIKFWEGIFPPKIMTGDYICIIGRAHTYNFGQGFVVRDCLLATGGGFHRSIVNVLKKYCVAPKTYMDLPPQYKQRKPVI